MNARCNPEAVCRLRCGRTIAALAWRPEGVGGDVECGSAHRSGGFDASAGERGHAGSFCEREAGAADAEMDALWRCARVWSDGRPLLGERPGLGVPDAGALCADRFAVFVPDDGTS